MSKKTLKFFPEDPELIYLKAAAEKTNNNHLRP
jgi:hypothetical protein